MHCSSPRDSGGLRMFAASIAPSAAPAPTSVWSSSMKRTGVVGVAELLDDLLEALLELAAVLRAGDERPDVEGQDALVEQDVRHVAGDDPMRQALGDARLADAGLADERGLFFVLRPRIWMTRSISFSRPMTGSSLPARAASVRLMPRASTVGVLELRLVSWAARPRRLRQDADDLVADLVEVHAEALEDAGGDALALADEAEQQVLRADVVVAEAAGLVDRELDDALRARGEPDLADDRAIARADDELDGGRTLASSTFMFSSTAAATPSPSRTRPSSRCSVPM
jgi:hypothetical protein